MLLTVTYRGVDPGDLGFAAAPTFLHPRASGDSQLVAQRRTDTGERRIRHASVSDGDPPTE